MKDPYASLLLHGVKTRETRNHAMLQGTSGPCLLHVGYKTMDESDAFEFLWRSGLVDESRIESMMRPPQGLQRGQVLGAMVLGSTRLYSREEQKHPDMQRAATAEAVGKFGTDVLKTWWLPEGLEQKGQPGIWKVQLPKKMVPEGLWEFLSSSGQKRLVESSGAPGLAELEAELPKLVVFDLDGICWLPEMYQTRGGPPYRIAPLGDVAVNSAGEEIRLFGAVQRVWSMLHSRAARGSVRLAVASSSRRHKAWPLLQSVQVSPGVTMAEVIDPELFEMYYRKGEFKRPHLEAILQKTGLKPSDVLFVDDNAQNVNSVRPLGVTAVHLPNGLTEEAWMEALRAYKQNRER